MKKKHKQRESDDHTKQRPSRSRHYIVETHASTVIAFAHGTWQILRASFRKVSKFSYSGIS